MHEVMNEILNFIGYLIPGYIGMFVYEMVRSTKMRNFSRVWGSLMVSFVAIKVLKWAFPSIGDKFGVLLMGACGISIIGGFALATFANNERVQDLLSRYFHFSTTNTILEEVIRTSSPGSVMRVYLKGRDFYVEGAVHSYNNTKPANKKSSMRDVKIYGYGKTREKYNKKAVRKGRPKGRRSTVIPPRQGQAASPCLRASLTLRAASAIGQPRG